MGVWSGSVRWKFGVGASLGWCLKLMGVEKEGGREREGGEEGVGRPCLFDPIITSGTNAQDQTRSGGRRGGVGHGRRHRKISAWLV